MKYTLTSTHLLSGAGGDTSGLQLAGFKPVAAINHLDVAIRSIRTNFPDCDARVANVEEMDMRRLPHTNVLCGSPICTELAPAAGNAVPVNVAQWIGEHVYAVLGGAR